MPTIDSYSFGRIVIDGKEYTKDVIIFPDKVKANWWRKEGHELNPEDLEDVINENPELLIVGTGASGLMKVKPETEELLKRKGIKLIALPTEQACKLFNEKSKTMKVVAALHLTC